MFWSFCLSKVKRLDFSRDVDSEDFLNLEKKELSF